MGKTYGHIFSVCLVKKKSLYLQLNLMQKLSQINIHKNVNRIAKEIKADVAQTNKKLDSLGSNIGQMKKPSRQSIWD